MGTGEHHPQAAGQSPRLTWSAVLKSQPAPSFRVPGEDEGGTRRVSGLAGEPSALQLKERSSPRADSISPFCRAGF